MYIGRVFKLLDISFCQILVTILNLYIYIVNFLIINTPIPNFSTLEWSPKLWKRNVTKKQIDITWHVHAY